MATSTITQKLSISTATASLIALFVGGTSQATTIDTTVGWTGGGYIFCSEPDCHYGQVFTVPTTENVLDSFSFFLSGSNPVIFYKTDLKSNRAICSLSKDRTRSWLGGNR